jgi:hypothetical protein
MFKEGLHQEIKEISANPRMENIMEELKIFSEMDSFSTKEENIRNCLAEKIRSFGLEVQIDEKGNLWAPSNDEKEGDFLLCAHMDKVGAGSELRFEDGEIKGRLDDAVGISIIMSLYKEGHRPSVLFTVEEESVQEIDESGEKKLIPRNLPNGIYNAGARFAALKVHDREIMKEKPKLIICLDVSPADKPGPNIYTSSFDFHYPNGPLKDIAKLLDKKGIKGVNWINGGGNDSIEFSFLEEQPLIAIGPVVDNIHTANEAVNADEVLKTAEVIETIMSEYEIKSQTETPAHFKHFKESKKAIEL